MKRRVLILSFAYPPSSWVGAFRPARFATYLHQFDWQPIVVAANFEQTRELRDDSRLRWSDERTIVIRPRLWEYPLGFKSNRTRGQSATAPAPNSNESAPRAARRKTIRARVLDLIRAAALPLRLPDKQIWWAVPALRALRDAAHEYKPEVVFCTTPPHSSQLIAMAFQAWTGIPFVMDLRDPWANAEWTGGRHRALKSAADRRLERRCVARAARVVLNTPEMLADFCQRYPAAWHSKFLAIPNGYDPQVRTNIESLNRSAERPAGASIRLCHAGSVYGRRDLRPLVEAVALLNRQGHNIVFEQVGTLANPGELAACIGENNAAGFIQLTGMQTHEEALRRMATADILVVVRQNTPIQVPAKLYEMMLFGKPILALDDEGAITRFVRDFDLGVVADPVNPPAIATAIEQAIAQIAMPPSDRREQALRQYDAREQTEQLAEVLKAAVESSRRARR